MHVIGHPAVGVESSAVTRYDFAHDGIEMSSIIGGKENILAVIIA